MQEIEQSLWQKKVKYDSFIPKLNKEYEEAYNDIDYYMDMGIENKIK